MYVNNFQRLVSLLRQDAFGKVDERFTYLELKVASFASDVKVSLVNAE